MHEGHRQRMLEKLAADETLQDHELLEILLFYAIPRKNTNETAHNLIDACGSLSKVFRADVKVLESVEGVGRSTAAFLKTVGAVLGRLEKAQARGDLNVAFSFQDFQSYIMARYAERRTELLELFSLDAKGNVSYVKTFSSGEKDHVEVKAEDVTHFLDDHRPRAVVIAHNHPSGDHEPSEQDNDFTKRVQMLCSLNNVNLLDHVIYGGGRVFSYRVSGRLEEIKRTFNIDNMILKS